MLCWNLYGTFGFFLLPTSQLTGTRVSDWNTYKTARHALSSRLYLHHHHQVHRNPDQVLVSARSFLQLILSWAIFFQLLIPSFLTSWATPFAHLSLGLPSFSNLATYPAHRIHLTLICETKSWSPCNLYNSLLYLLLQWLKKSSQDLPRKYLYSTFISFI